MWACCTTDSWPNRPEKARLPEAANISSQQRACVRGSCARELQLNLTKVGGKGRWVSVRDRVHGALGAMLALVIVHAFFEKMGGCFPAIGRCATSTVSSSSSFLVLNNIIVLLFMG
jgi:hypothetical protein